MDVVFGKAYDAYNEDKLKRTATTPSASKMDDLFGPAPRRAVSIAARPSTAVGESWLGSSIGARGRKKNDDSDSDDGGFKSALAKKKLEKTVTILDDSPRKPEKKKSTHQPDADLSFLTGEPTQPKKSQVTFQGVSSADADAVARLQQEIKRLSQELTKQRERKKEDEETIIQEWKDKLGRVQYESDKELERVKEIHKRAIEELESDRSSAIDRVKQSMGKELEAAASAYQHTRSYHEVVDKVETAVDQLSNLSTNVSGLNEKTNIERETVLVVREERVKHMEERLEKEFKDLTVEKEKVHSVLLKMDTNSKELEKHLEQERWQLVQDQNKFQASKSAFREEQKVIATAIENKRVQVDSAREQFLNEQHDILARVLREQEIVQQEKAAFATQKTRDAGVLRQQAMLLEERMREVERASELIDKTRCDYERKMKRLVELEQTLMDECEEIDRVREDVDRQRRTLREANDLLKDRQLEMMKVQSDSQMVSNTRRTAWDGERGTAHRQREQLHQQERELDQRADDLRQIQLGLHEAQKKFHCPECGFTPVPTSKQQQNQNPNRQGVQKNMRRVSHQDAHLGTRSEKVRLTGDFEDRNFDAGPTSDDMQQVGDQLEAERPYDSPTSETAFVRSGSIRSVLKHHAKLLEQFITH